MFQFGRITIQWLGHDGFRLEAGGKVVYIDPYKLSGSRRDKHDADLVLISHDHFDHLSPEDLKHVISAKTSIAAARECIGKIRDVGAGEVKAVSPGDRLSIRDIAIEAVAAYNTNKPFHPKADGKVGFVVTLDNNRIYHTGDTDYIPEMSSTRADVALVPVSGTYVMTAQEAANAVNESIKPRLAIPMHYGSIVGSEKDAKVFADLVKVCPVKVLERE